MTPQLDPYEQEVRPLVTDQPDATLEELYSHDLNPIEMVFSKLKTLVRKFKLRKVDELWKKLGELCDVFTPKEYRNYFTHAGYQK